jgi:hypothetical protein
MVATAGLDILDKIHLASDGNRNTDSVSQSLCLRQCTESVRT